MFETFAIALVLLAPAIVTLGWLALFGTLIGAVGASSDGDLDELRLLRSAPPPTR